MPSNNKSEIEFMPFIYLDNPVFDVLLEKFYNLNIIKRKDDKYYIFQAKLMLYTTFNKYLHLLFLDIDDEKLIKILENLETSKTADEVFVALEEGLKDKKVNIIDKFIKYFKNNK